jgi:hypothetical protein
MRIQRLFLLLSLMLFTALTKAENPLVLSVHLGDVEMNLKASLKDQVDADSLRFFLQQKFFRTVELYSNYGPYSWVHRFNAAPVSFYGEPKYVFDHCYRHLRCYKRGFRPQQIARPTNFGKISHRDII